jgi:uncharacterized damage-inducible protein DinB
MGLTVNATLEGWARELIEYQTWRRKKVSNLLLEVDEKIFTQQLTGSFGSLYIILNHLVWAEKVWLGRVNRDTVATMKPTDVGGLLEMWKEVNDNWKEVIRAATKEDILREIEYFTYAGGRFSNTVLEIVIHMVDHSTYHVGQMINAMRSFGIEPVSTNYIHYLRDKV